MGTKRFVERDILKCTYNKGHKQCIPREVKSLDSFFPTEVAHVLLFRVFQDKANHANGDSADRQACIC